MNNLLKLVVVLFNIIIATAFAVFWLRPSLDALHVLNTTVELMEIRNNNLLAAEEAFENNLIELELIGLEKNRAFPLILAEISHNVSDNNLNQLNFAASQPVGLDTVYGIHEMRVNIVCEGNIHNITRFLKNLGHEVIVLAVDINFEGINTRKNTELSIYVPQ